jgi:hypothetical protein
LTIRYDRYEDGIKRSYLGIPSFVFPRQSTRDSRERLKGRHGNRNDPLRVSDFDPRLALASFHSRPFSLAGEFGSVVAADSAATDDRDSKFH